MSLNSHPCHRLSRTAALAALALAGPLAWAQISLTTTTPCVEPGHDIHLSATREDGHAPNWRWALRQAPGDSVQAHLVATENGLRALALRGPGPLPTTLRFRVTDLNGFNAQAEHPFAEIDILVIPSMLALVAPAELASDGVCDLSVTRADGKAATCKWRVLEPQGGLLLPGPGASRRYQAPPVLVPSTFHIQVTDLEGHRATLPIRVLPRVTLGLHPAQVISGNQSTLTASRSDGQATRWYFLVEGAHGGAIDYSGADGKARYTAPEVTRPTTFALHARDQQHLRDGAKAFVHVLPRYLPPQGESTYQNCDLLMEQLLPQGQGGPLIPLPSASLWVGTLDNPWNQAKPFNNLRCLAFVEEDASLGPLSRKWLVGDDDGLKAVNAQGEVAEVLQERRTIHALAVCPSTSSRPSRILCASSAVGGAQVLIEEVRPDGTRQLLAGLEGSGATEGDGPEPTFGPVYGLAADPDGTVYVLEDARLRTLSPQGQVSTMAWLKDGAIETPAMPEVHDGLPGDANAVNLAADPGHLLGLALDPATGSLYLCHSRGLLERTPEGPWNVLIDHLTYGWSVTPPFQPARGSGMPEGLHLHGRKLYIPDPGHHAIRVFDLDTRQLTHLAGNKNQVGTRMGPLGDGSPAQNPGDCAALESPVAVFINDEGTGMVGLPYGLVHLALDGLLEQETAIAAMAVDASGPPAAASSTTAGGAGTKRKRVEASASRTGSGATEPQEKRGRKDSGEDLEATQKLDSMD